MKRLLVTRAADRSGPLADALAPHGIQVLSLPMTESVDTGAPLPEPGDYAWVVFTSARAVEAVARREESWRRHLAPGARIAAVGGSTAAAARDRLGLTLDLEGASTGADLAGALLRAAPEPGRILWPCAVEVAGGLAETLAQAGSEPKRWTVYKTSPRAPEVLRDELAALPPWQAILFAAPSAVRAFAAGREKPWDRPCVAIGPTTRDALAEAGAATIHLAPSPDTSGQVEAALACLNSQGMDPSP